jgi:hypothetical protein
MTKYEVVGWDADLDSEVVLLPNGERLTNQVADEIADDLLGRRGLGRPSLASDGSHSPRVSFRVPDEVRALAVERAAAENVSLSVLARKALERYLKDAG